MAGCRAHTELEAEKLTCEIVELENSVVHLVNLCGGACGDDVRGAGRRVGGSGAVVLSFRDLPHNGTL